MSIGKYFIFLPLLIAFSSFGQTQNQIEQIDHTVKEINSQRRNFKKIELIASDTAKKTAYLLNNEVALIVVQCVDQSIQKTVKWWFNKRELIYCEQTWKRPSQDELVCGHLSPFAILCYPQPEQDSLAPIEGPTTALSPKKEFIDVVDHQQFYLKNGHLVAWIKNDTLLPHSTEFKAVDAQLAAYGQKLLRTMKR